MIGEGGRVMFFEIMRDYNKYRKGFYIGRYDSISMTTKIYGKDYEAREEVKKVLAKKFKR